MYVTRRLTDNVPSMKRPAVGKYRWRNEEHGIVPQTIKKEIRDLPAVTKAVAKEEDKEVDINTNKQESAKNSSKTGKTNARMSKRLTFEIQPI